MIDRETGSALLTFQLPLLWVRASVKKKKVRFRTREFKERLTGLAVFCGEEQWSAFLDMLRDMVYIWS